MTEGYFSEQTFAHDSLGRAHKAPHSTKATGVHKMPKEPGNRHTEADKQMVAADIQLCAAVHRDILIKRGALRFRFPQRGLWFFHEFGQELVTVLTMVGK